MNAEAVQRLPGSPLVVEYSQLELLAKANHYPRRSQHCARFAQQWVPLVAIPITYEQPGINESWTGGREVVPLTRLSIPRLRAAIQRVLRRILTTSCIETQAIDSPIRRSNASCYC